MPILETKNLKKYYKVKDGLLHAVDGVSISIEKGQTLGVVGESGCGKSTFGRVVLGLEKPTGGDVLFGEKSIKFQIYFSYFGEWRFSLEMQAFPPFFIRKILGISQHNTAGFFVQK